MAILNAINEETVKKVSEQMNLRQVRENVQMTDNVKIEETQKKFVVEMWKEQFKEKDIQDAIEKLNNTIQIFNKRLRLSFHEEAKRYVIKVIDSETDKLIREIPEKEFLDFLVRLHQMIGVFIDKKR